MAILRYILFFLRLMFKIYLFTYTDSAMMISMEEESMRDGQLVSGHRRSTCRNEKADRMILGVVWRVEFEHFVDTLFT